MCMKRQQEGRSRRLQALKGGRCKKFPGDAHSIHISPLKCQSSNSTDPRIIPAEQSVTRRNDCVVQEKQRSLPQRSSSAPFHWIPTPTGRIAPRGAVLPAGACHGHEQRSEASPASTGPCTRRTLSETNNRYPQELSSFALILCNRSRSTFLSASGL